MRRFIPQWLGFFGGVLALFLFVYSSAGALWGWLRPTITVQADADGAFRVTDMAELGSAQFAGFGSFVLITGILAAVLSYLVVRSVRRAHRVVGIGWMLVLALLSLGAALAMWYVGGVVSSATAESTDTVKTLAPAFFPGVGLLFAPWASLFATWSYVYLAVPEEAEDTALPGVADGSAAQHRMINSQ